MPLTGKLFIFSSVLIIVPLVLVGLVSYRQSAVELEEEATQYNWQLMEQVETHVEYYMRDLEITSLRIVNDSSMAALLNQKSADTAAASGATLAVENTLKNAAYSRADISNIYVFADNIAYLDARGPKSLETVASMKAERWYSSIPSGSAPLLISRMLSLPDRYQPVITLARRLYSPQTLEPAGVLLIDVNFRRIKEIADKVSVTRGGYFFILDSEGHYVYHPDEKKIGKNIDQVSFDFFVNAEEGTPLRSNNGKEFLTFSHSSYLGWRFVTSVPYDELSRPASRIGQIVLLTAIVTLIAAYVLGTFFATSLIRPIRRLQQFMKQVEVGDFSARVGVKSADEIGQLSRGFNKMVERLAQLMEEIYFTKLRETEARLGQKEMELKVLQSQINPHFLCNSLETMRGMALVKGSEEVATMAAALGQLLRYNLRTHTPIVSLKEEVKFSHVYMQVQQFRFDGQFTYEFNIPEWAWELPVPKFSLQPLVENCFAHAIGRTAETLHIAVTVELENDSTYMIKISDNGPGIEPETLQQIYADLAEKDVTSGGSSIGLVNVHRRIHRRYEEGYGLTVISIPGEGTTVIVRLPLAEEVKDSGDE